MQKNIVMQRALFLLVFCFLSNNLCASFDDQTSRNYDPIKTEQLKKVIDHEYPRVMWQALSCVAKKILHISNNYPQEILQLIEQGADPNAQSHVHKGTAVHVLCERSYYIENFSEVLAKLRFFKARTDIKDRAGYAPCQVWRQVWILADQPHSQPIEKRDKLAEFDATIAATDKVKQLKKQETDQAYLKLLTTHFPNRVVDIIDDYRDRDQTVWDPTCWSAIQQTMGIPQEKALMPKRQNLLRRK